MTNFVERIASGAPLRVSELAAYTGYSETQVRKWIDAGQIQTVAFPEPAESEERARTRGRPAGVPERRIPAKEAERIGRILQLIQ